MPRDLQIISIVDDLDVSSVEEIEGSVPRAIRVRGPRGYRTTKRVTINDRGVDSFTVISDRQLIVYPGSAFDGVGVASMQVFLLSGAQSMKRKVRLVLEITNHPHSVEGLQKLIQRVIRVLTSRSGSNRYDPEDGGNLLQEIGRSLSPSGRAQISAGLATSLSRTKEYLLAVQPTSGLALDEKLLDLELVGLNFIPENMEVQATIRVSNAAGAAAEIPLTL